MSRQNQRLLRPILDRNADTRIAERFLLLVPVRHVFCGILLDGIARALRPRWLAFPMFAVPPAIEVRDFKSGDRKFFGDAVLMGPEQLSKQHLLDNIDTLILPFFRSLEAFDHLYSYAMNDPIEIWQREALHFRLELAMGNFSAARMLMRWHRTRWSTDTPPDKLDAAGVHERQLCELLDTGDHDGIARVLREVEATASVSLAVDHLWQPSPFPFEHGYAEWLGSQAVGKP